MLAAALMPFEAERPIVLGLPRGGVPVAREVARILGAPLDIWVVRKLGAPMQEELGMGAVAEGGEVFVDPTIVEAVGATQEDVRRVIDRKTREVEERCVRFRGDGRAPTLSGRTVLLVDDGVATGGTARAALRAIRKQQPKRLVLAVPVGSTDTLRSLEEEADDVVCLERRDDLGAVGAWYEDFRAVQDEDVIDMLDGAGRLEPIEGEIDVPIDEGWLRGTLALPHGACCVVVFAHGSGSSRKSTRNRKVAAAMHRAELGTLLVDLLTEDEQIEDERDERLRFDIPLLARRLSAVTSWVREQPVIGSLAVGYFGASTGAAAALIAASERKDIAAIVSRGGRPDLAADRLHAVKAPTLFIVGGDDAAVLALNRSALRRMSGRTKLEIIPGATHLFEEPGALDRVAELAARWFVTHLARPGAAMERENKVKNNDEDEELEDQVQCMDCGAVFDPAFDRGFAVSEEDYLCFRCSERRGGIYDEAEDRWTRAPDTSERSLPHRTPRYARRAQ